MRTKTNTEQDIEDRHLICCWNIYCYSRTAQLAAPKAKSMTEYHKTKEEVPR